MVKAMTFLLLVLQSFSPVFAQTQDIDEPESRRGQFQFALHYDIEIRYGGSKTPFTAGRDLSHGDKVVVVTHVNGSPSQTNGGQFTYRKLAEQNLSVTRSIVRNLGVSIDHFVFYTEKDDGRSSYYDPFMTVLAAFNEDRESALPAEELDVIASVFFRSEHVGDIASVKGQTTEWTPDRYRNFLISSWARDVLIDMAVMAMRSGDYELSSRLLEPAISVDHPPAMYLMAAIQDNLGDKAGSVSWLKKASDEGHRQATYMLALRLESGAGIPQNHDESIRLLTVAAEAGHSQAAFRLGRHYLDGKIVAQNSEEAARWLAVAEAGGIGEASPFKGKAEHLLDLERQMATLREETDQLTEQIAALNEVSAILEVNSNHPLNRLSHDQWKVLTIKMQENRSYYDDVEGIVYWRRVEALARQLGFFE